MDIISFITEIFVLTDDWVLQQPTFRRSGPKPLLSDSEVLTLEVVGEFLGLDEDKAIFTYFRTHFAAEFPMLKQVHRTTFTRQAANLWKIKERFWLMLISKIKHDPHLTIVDSMPVPVCRFARANRCRLFEESAAYGYDHVARQRFYGYRLHVRIAWPGVITGFVIAPANEHDLHTLPELTQGVTGWMLGDRNYWSPDMKERLAKQGIEFLAPYKSRSHEPDHLRWPLWLTQARQRIETVFAQLVQRLNGHKTQARDFWHLSSRWLRKVLAHTLGIYMAQLETLESPLQFDAILDS